MSTPFPLEEQSADERLNGPMSDPWHGPAKPGFWTGMGYFNEDTAGLGPSYRIAEALGSGAAKAERAAADLLHQDEAVDPMNMGRFGLSPADVEMAEREKLGVNALSDTIAADAKQRVQAMTPDAATTGTAVQIVHGLGEGAYLATVGGLAGGLPGAAALTGGVEASGTYHEQVEAGVSPTAAAESAGVTAVTSAAGVLIPGGFGSSLASKLLTGAGAQVGLGLASRYADHKILEANGYPEMAAQQKVWDSTQVLTDAFLGLAFGGIAHLHGHEAKAIEAAAKEPGMVDAALATNLAVQDRNLAPGVPVDPAATHAHLDALELSNQQLLEGKPNDVSQSGVNEAKFAQRPVDEAHQAEAQAIAREYVPEQAYLAKGEYEALASLEDREIKDVPREPHISETPEMERAANEPYLPADTEIAESGAKPSGENADRVALIARAAEIDPARIEALAAQHAGDSNAFIEAARQVIDEHAATAQRGESGARAQGAGGEPGVSAERSGGGRGSREGTAAAAGAGEPAGSRAATERNAAPLADTVQAALRDRPDLKVVADDGNPVRAADLLRQVQEDGANEIDEFHKAVNAATNCYARRGA